MVIRNLAKEMSDGQWGMRFYCPPTWSYVISFPSYLQHPPWIHYNSQLLSPCFDRGGGKCAAKGGRDETREWLGGFISIRRERGSSWDVPGAKKKLTEDEGWKRPQNRERREKEDRKRKRIPHHGEGARVCHHEPGRRRPTLWRHRPV